MDWKRHFFENLKQKNPRRIRKLNIIFSCLTKLNLSYSEILSMSMLDLHGLIYLWNEKNPESEIL